MSTTTCGYCKMLKQFVEKNITDTENYVYFLMNQYELIPETEGYITYKHMINNNVRGVPFTALVNLDTKEVEQSVRGYDPLGVTELFNELQELSLEEEE